jgi:hypothetical protein
MSEKNPLFLDVLPLTVLATNDALEYIFKSNHTHDDGIWLPHDSLLVRRLIELFSRRGLDRLDYVRDQIIAWQNGEHYKEAAVIIPRPNMMERWSKDELALVKIYLESLFPTEWTLDDHMMAIDYVVQRYLPADELKTEAEWLTTRAGLMGKVQANLDAAVVLSSAVVDKILAAMPSTVDAAATQFNLPAQQKSMLDFARVRAAENVRALTESVRHDMRSTIITHLEGQTSAVAGTPSQSLQSKLFDKFAVHNRDWRRIAVTEAGEAQTQGYVASLALGTKIKRVERYANACAFCRKIDGVIATVVSPDHPSKNHDTDVWVGKNNIGRSASPRKRVGDVFVPRTPDEMWHLPAGLAHPHCRGRWVPVIEAEAGDDPDFAAWLQKTLA